MRIIGKIISCVLVALLYAPNASAFLNSTLSVQTNLFHIVPPIDRTQNQNPNKSRPQAPALVLPETGSVSHYSKEAKVHFIVDTADKIGFDDISQSFDHDNANRCKNLGFTKTTACGANKNKGRTCPYDDSYFDKCCDKNYAYGKSECSYPNTISTASCNSKYKCYCDRTLYPYTSCAAPKITGSDKCAEINYTGGKATTTVYYSACQCPSGYRTCGTNQVGLNTNGTDGGACNEDGQNKYAGCRCKDGYSLTCSDYGPKNSSDYCMIGTKYYKECKTINDVCAEELKNKYPSYTVTHGDCATYENQLATCSKDSSFKVCQPTCRSQILALYGHVYNIDTNGFIYMKDQPNTAYVVENSDTVPLRNSITNTEYTYIYGPSLLSYKASTCTALARPRLTASTTQNNYVLSRNFNGVDIYYNTDKYYINSAASFYDVNFSGNSSITFNIDGSGASLSLTSGITTGKYISVYATNRANVTLNENTKVETIDIKSGSSLYVGGGGNNNISYLTVDGSGSKASLSYSKNLNISTATVSNYGNIQADDSGSSGRTYAIGTLNVNSYGVFRTNYIKPFTITTLNASNRGFVKVGSSGEIKVTGTINLRSCSRLCTYNGSFYYRNSVANCYDTANCTIYYGSDKAPMSENDFNYSKCYSKKSLGDRWLSTKRCNEMCGSSYTVDTVTVENC